MGREVQKAKKVRPKEIINFIEPELKLSCPRRIRSRMRLNLHKAAGSSIDLQRQKKVEELLAVTEAEAKKTASKGAGTSPATAMAASPMPPAQSTIEPAVPKAPQAASRKFKRYIQRVSNFVRGK